MTEQGKETSSVYSGGEVKMMMYSQKVRGKLMKHVMIALKQINVKPNHITFTSLLFGIISAVLFNYSVFGGIIMLAIHCLLDGLDGPYARFSGLSSKLGEMLDVISDQVTVILNAVALISINAIDTANGIIYMVLYTMVVIIAFVRNRKRIPYRILLRPRFIIYLWIIAEFYWWPGSLQYAFIVCNAILLIHVLTGFYKLGLHKGETSGKSN